LAPQYGRESLAQVPADLLRAPALLQQLRDHASEFRVGLDPPVTNPSSPAACTPMRFKRPVASSAPDRPVAPQFPGHGRRCSADPMRDLADADALTVEICDLDALLL